MANLCKFDKKQYQVSYDSGVTWENVIPEQIDRGDNMIEYDSPDCSSVDTMYRWRLLDGQYMCDDKEKWTKEIREESYNNGLTWYTSYPTVYRKGTYVGIDEAFCNDKFVGHYVYDASTCSSGGGDGGGGTPSHRSCGRYKIYIGGRCVYVDPLKVVKCNDNNVLNKGDVDYYAETCAYHLVSAEIGDCVTEISGYAFYGCSSLSSVTIGNSVITISGYAFNGCKSLSSVTIGSGVTTIGISAFNNCSGLTSIDIPDSVTSIGQYAFYGCSGLTSITVNATTPPTLGTFTFHYTNDCPIYVPCQSLYLYKVSSGWSDYASRIQGIPPCVPTPTGATKIQTSYSDGQNFFKYCDSSTVLTSKETHPSGYETSGMTSAVIGDCVTSIDRGAFEGCTSLSSVTLPDSVTIIGLRAFYECASLTTCTIDSGVTSIGNSAFFGCSGLISCTIGSGVTSIGNSAFFGCSSLSSITINATTPPTLNYNGEYATYAFDNTNNCPINVPAASVNAYKSASSWSKYTSRIRAIHPDTPTGATKFYATYSNGDVYWDYCNSSTLLTSGETRPSGYQFSAMTSAEIGDCVTSISTSAFTYCSGLTSCTIGSGVTSIGDFCFYDCSGLTSINIPNGVTSIGEYAFDGCTSLTSVTIGSGMTNINYGAFYGCTSLTSITVNATTPPTLGNRAFQKTNDCPIYVPSQSVDVYKSASGWSGYASRIQPIT